MVYLSIINNYGTIYILVKANPASYKPDFFRAQKKE